MAATGSLLLTEAELQPGDLLLGRTGEWHCWLSRLLDRSHYSNAGIYDGERVIVCGPWGVERRPPSPAAVFRFHHHGRHPGCGGFEKAELLEPARAYLRAAPRHRSTPLYQLGLLLIMRRSAHSGWQRAVVEVFGDLLVAAVRRSVNRYFAAGSIALTGPELITRLFLTARSATGHPFEMLVAPEVRHLRGAWPPTCGRFERLMQELEEILTRANPELPIAISRARSTAPASAEAAVVAGGPLAPDCFITPGDLQHSPSLVHVGRLVPWR